MINAAIERYIDNQLKQVVQDKFYPYLIDYMQYILDALKKGNHLGKKNEMKSVGSQYLSLYYVPLNDDRSYIVLEDDQHEDTVFKVCFSDMKKEVSVYKGIIDLKKAMKDRQTEGTISKSGKIQFDSTKQLRDVYAEYRDSFVIDGRTTQEILQGKESYNEIFSVAKYSFDEKYQISDRGYYTFQQQLAIFTIVNTMLCGVSSNIGQKDFPKKFKDDMSESIRFAEELNSKLKELTY